MVVTLAVDGAVVRDADDCRALHVESALGPDALRTVLDRTGTGAVEDDGAVRLDVGVLRSRARLAATAEDWPQRWSGLLDRARDEGALSADGRTLRAVVEPVPDAR
jgi:hypothetical protein